MSRPGDPGGEQGEIAAMSASIEVRALTKRYGATTAVSDLTFTVRPGVVTGFLGPNGAGKSTTMRMILGLDEPDSGSVTVGGRPPRAHSAPLREVGGMLDPRPSTRPAAPTTTCSRWRRPTASAGPGWRR